MSYISAIRKRDEVLVWERHEVGRVEKYYPAPFYFFVEDPGGKYKSIYGDSLSQVQFRDGGEFNSAKNDLVSSRIKLYESDIPPELKVLSKYYYNVPAPKLHVTFLDIEVDYDNTIGFSSVNNPYAPINSVSLYHQHSKLYTVFAVPPPGSSISLGKASLEFFDQLNEIVPLPVDAPCEIIFCKNERELLLNLIVEIEDSDVLSGWNSDFFDIPYIAKRIETVLGKNYFRKLSFPNAELPKYRTEEVFGREVITIDLSGRISCDYMALFKKYEMDGRPSYKLESIAEEVVPELPKLEYDGTLHDLYKSNFAWFVRYNIRDTEILKGFEEKLGYVELANQMCHISTGLFKHVTGTLKLAELAIINYCHHELNLRVNNNNVDEDSGSIQGAYVLDPKKGMHEWLGSIDINSLYPSSIRSINISPETLIGQFTDAIKAADEIAKGSYVKLIIEYEDHTEEEHTADEWRQILWDNKWAVSGYGTVFSQEKQGIIPAILETWYATRKEYQKKAKTSKDKDEAAYYDRLQYVYKIKLNSLYGALNNQFFRFYDLRMGESTTGTGRAILRHQCARANELLTDEYDVLGEAIIYGDTDSTYFETWATNEEDAIQVADAVADGVNKSFQPFMRKTFLCQPGYDDIIKAGREVVANRGIFVDKKRYILRVVDSEGKKVDKLKVMGLDTKKTTLPKVVSKALNEFVGRLLRGEEWDTIANDIVEYKEALRNSKNILDIGLPKGVNGVEDYTQRLQSYGTGQRLPGHVAASIFYNQCLEQYNDKENLPIISGMKIKVFYLTADEGRFKSVAIPTDTKVMPTWFIENFKVDLDAHIERLVDNPLDNIINAIGKSTPSRQSLLTDSLLDF